jgi:hypothetical protein
MKITVVVAFAWLLVAGCDRSPDHTQGSSDANQPLAQTSSASRSSRPLHHFWFFYQAQPLPGTRVWINSKETNWVEMYPDGSQSRYRTVSHETVDGMTGTVVTKTQGDLETSQTFNDGSFQVFLPDREFPKLILYFRHKIQNEWEPWRPLAEVYPIE